MAQEKLYQGVGPFDEEPTDPILPGEYTVADQAAGWGVPAEQLTPDVPKTVTVYTGGGSGEKRVPAEDILLRQDL